MSEFLVILTFALWTQATVLTAECVDLACVHQLEEEALASEGLIHFQVFRMPCDFFKLSRAPVWCRPLIDWSPL